MKKTLEKKTKPETATSFLHIRCKRSDKGKWKRKAYPGKLSQWVVNKLNEVK